MKSVDAGTRVDDAHRLLDIVQALAHELHPQATHARPLSLGDSLDRDYGLDSLARVELIARIERAFSVRLPEGVFAEIETPRDLLPHLDPTVAAQIPVQQMSEFVSVPAEHPGELVTTLIDALEWHSARHPDRVHIMLYGEHEVAIPLTYAHLRNRATEVAMGLIAHGVEPGEAIAIMLPTGADFFAAFYGALYARAVPVPVYPPARASQLEEHLRRIAGILTNANAKVLMTIAYAKPLARLLQILGTRIRLTATVGEIALPGTDLAVPALVASDTAFLQYTSGSTGHPKGVVLSHANLLANLRAMAAATRASSKDVFVSWLPLYHDMGLIGACLGAMLYAFPLVLMSPFAFLGRPLRWLSMIQRHRATITAGPNFAYELCVNKIDDAALQGLDLSSLRLAFNGAEAVSPSTVERFCARFAPYGLARTAMTPVYGLAECSVGLTFPPLERGPVIDSVERTSMLHYGSARPARPDDASPLRALELIWGGWTIVLVALVAPAAWLLVILLPSVVSRRHAARIAARLFFALCGAPLHVSGRENLPHQGPLVLVANHASYLDSLVLTAALPARIAFVAKRELAVAFPLGIALKRIGTLFVERDDLTQSVVDAAQLEQHVRSGGWLMVFPEGTFHREAGLLAFHMGAFVTAAQTATPVVPIAIHGTRSILPSGAGLPHRGQIALSIGVAFTPTGPDWGAALQLRDQTRVWLAAALTE